MRYDVAFALLACLFGLCLSPLPTSKEKPVMDIKDVKTIKDVKVMLQQLKEQVSKLSNDLSQLKLEISRINDELQELREASAAAAGNCCCHRN